ncbi:UNVERIFIED_CONTAM: hypothetical protein GTU68_003146, partial [Idotea baltica]|nr:hypothetical protein [Idotea baltica]
YISFQERYCDATIACQGRYFPVHRVVLSTCSDYFDEMFERMQCQHPYIVFKDIEPREMELLLNYMYQGEVNVVQEMLPTLIKAAEALKVKGLAVPDDLPAAKESSGGKKRSSTSNDSSQPKRRSEENKRRRRDSSEFVAKNLETSNSADNSHTTSNILPDMEHIDERPLIKEEPLDPSDYGNESLPRDDSVLPHSSNSQPLNKEDVFVNFPITDDSSTYVKTEDNLSSEQPYEEHQVGTY